MTFWKCDNACSKRGNRWTSGGGVAENVHAQYLRLKSTGLNRSMSAILCGTLLMVTDIQEMQEI